MSGRYLNPSHRWVGSVFLDFHNVLDRIGADQTQNLLLDLVHIPGLQVYMLSYAGRYRIVNTLKWLENSASLNLFDAVIFTQERQDTAQKSGILKHYGKGEAYQARSNILLFCGGKDSLMRLAVAEQCSFKKPFYLHRRQI